jgi:AcrR family transcriptional regulator
VDAVRTPRTGRRPGCHDTRAEILAAARHCFAEAGYDKTTMRQIAAHAGIDAALVHRRFGSKLDLFLAAVGLPADLTELLATTLTGSRHDVGRRVVQTFVDLWDNAPLQGASFTGLLRLATGDRNGAALLNRYLRGNLAPVVVHRLGVSDAERRITLVGSQLLGIGVARYVLRMEPLASATSAAIAGQLGPIVQQLLLSQPRKGPTP